MRSPQILLVGLLPLLFLSGCQTPKPVKQVMAKNPFSKNAAKTPAEIVDVWNSYAQVTSEGKTMRGMAGRIHFYDHKKKSQAVKVDGDLNIYVFDGRETDPSHAKPIKVFQFQADTLAQHHSYQKPLGHGYDFFLPMDEIGGEEMPLCIMVRFDDHLNEMLVMAQPVNTILAGRKPQTPTEPTIREFLESRSLLAEANQSISTHFDSSIQQVGHVEEKQNTVPEKSKVSTIPLNGDMTRRLTEAKETIAIPERLPLKQNDP